MTRLALALVALSFAWPALAHPGHVAPSGGHDHWLAFGLIALAALAAAAWLIRRAAIRRSVRRV
jgi:hypothetical protein